jgi:predicted DNA-binding transcriptional regulator AlpA
MNGWLDLKRAAEYCSLSIRTLWRYIGDPHHPLPVRIVGGKWLTHPTDLDQWIKSFPRGREDIDRLVEEVISDVRKGVKHGRKTT